MTNLQLVENANYQIVHEVYDLLSNPDGQSMTVLRRGTSNEWLLTKPNFTQPLRKMRFGTFRPIYKPGFINRTFSATMTVKPHIITFDSTQEHNKFVEVEISETNKRLYSKQKNTDDGVEIPVSGYQFSFNFDGTFSNLSHEINDFLGNYFSDFYTEGYFYYYDGTNTHESVANLDDIIDDAVVGGAKVIDTGNGYNLIYFNTDETQLPTMNSDIKITNIWVKFSDSNTFLVFTFDLNTNWHSFSVDTGLLFNVLFDRNSLPEHSGAYYVNDIVCCNYDDDLTFSTRAVIDSGLTISLCSAYAGNLSSKIFTGENLYHTVDVETFPSSMYFPITIKNKYNEDLSVEELSSVYDQITLGVDYIYLTY